MIQEGVLSVSDILKTPHAFYLRLFCPLLHEHIIPSFGSALEDGTLNWDKKKL